MPFELNPNKKLVTINVWGEEVNVYTKRPTPSMVRRYNSAIIGKKGLRFKKLFSIRTQFGLELIDGFPPGEMALNGKILEEDSEGQWKGVVKQECPQIIEALARHLLDNSRVEEGDNDDDEDDDEEEEDPEEAAHPTGP